MIVHVSNYYVFMIVLLFIARDGFGRIANDFLIESCVESAVECFHREYKFTSMSEDRLTIYIPVKALADLFTERQTYTISIRIQTLAFRIFSLK